MRAAFHAHNWERARPVAAGAALAWPSQLSVLAVTPIFDNGGTEVQLLELAAGLGERGHRFRLVTGTGARLAELGEQQIPYRLVRQTAGLVARPVELAAYAAAIYRELCASAVQVVQSTSIRTTYAASLAIFAYTLRHPCAAEPALITTLHGGKQHDIYAEARRHLRMLGDAVIVVSETGRAALAQDDDHHHHAARANRVHVVAPGRDLRAFVEVAQGRVAPAVLDRVPQDARVVLHAGRLAPLKGQRYLLEAWALAKPKLDGAVLVIAGSGELADDLRQQATELGVADSVVFAGFRSDLPALLARADLFALSSLWEGLPMAAVEAMAAERPIVATRAGGTPDVVADGETGLLVPPADPAALAQALTRVLGDAALRGRLAQAGGRRVAQTYTREALVTATLAVYQLAWARRQRFNHQLLMSYEV